MIFLFLFSFTGIVMGMAIYCGAWPNKPYITKVMPIERWTKTSV